MSGEMDESAIHEGFDGTGQVRGDRLDKWSDVCEPKQMDVGNVTTSEIMPADLVPAKESLDDDLMNQ
jgi:hypothetical protein